ncbi:MAG: nitroreductase family protein [Thermoplasmatales archaeon]|nr:MAG: nitroreductase family protein [Thermoplasmatales archaeon]
MDVFEAIEKRRSIRDYEDRLIEDEKLLKLLEAARLAPSAKNRQNWKFIIIKDKEIKKRFVVAFYEQKFIEEAPIVIAGIANPNFKWYRIDMGIAFEHIALTAVELGLGTCWIGAFDEKEVSNILKVTKTLETVILMTVGYQKSTPKKTLRKEIHSIIYHDYYS